MTDKQQRAYEWAKNQNYTSVAAQYAKELCGLVDELQATLYGQQQAVKNAPLTDWINVKDKLPTGEDETVLTIVSGKPCENITLDGACELAAYSESEGWIIEQYPEWETPEVAYWMPLPEPPKENRPG